MNRFQNRFMEEWRDIKGFEGIYQVSDLGRVKALSRTEKFPCMFNGSKIVIRKERVLTPRVHSHGYLRVALGFGRRVDYYIHRIVCAAFKENIDSKSEVNHINGIKTDNRVENLEWCTREENAKHASKNGLLQTGFFRITNSKLDEIQVRTIKSIGSGMTNKQLGEYFKVSKNAISHINMGKTWSHL